MQRRSNVQRDMQKRPGIDSPGAFESQCAAFKALEQTGSEEAGTATNCSSNENRLEITIAVAPAAPTLEDNGLDTLAYCTANAHGGSHDNTSAPDSRGNVSLSRTKCETNLMPTPAARCPKLYSQMLLGEQPDPRGINSALCLFALIHQPQQLPHLSQLTFIVEAELDVDQSLVIGTPCRGALLAQCVHDAAS